MIIISIIAVILLVTVDQYTKYLAYINLKDNGSIPIIKNIFELTYVENWGAAFGMFQNKRIFFIIITIVIMSALSYYYIKLPREKKYLNIRITFILIASGALGNFIDRVRFDQGYVIDFLYFKLIDFPVFNVADCYVVVGSILLAFLLLFVYKEEF